jgi:hypothetical protein
MFGMMTTIISNSCMYMFVVLLLNLQLHVGIDVTCVSMNDEYRYDRLFVLMFVVIDIQLHPLSSSVLCLY